VFSLTLPFSYKSILFVNQGIQLARLFEMVFASVANRGHCFWSRGYLKTIFTALEKKKNRFMI